MGGGQMTRQERRNAQQAQRTPRPSIDVHIEELVLEGFAPGDRYGIADAVQSELGRLLSEQGLPPAWEQGGEADSLDGGAFQVSPGSKAEGIGAQIAQAVHGGLAE